jgi:hemerythrin-like metal-binding protein
VNTGLWKDDYRLGVDWLDDQHVAICGLVELLMAAINDKRDKPAIGAILGALNVRLAEHFRDEERYLRQAGCPETDIAEHVDGHRNVQFILDHEYEKWRQAPAGADRATELSNLCRCVWVELVSADLALKKKLKGLAEKP